MEADSVALYGAGDSAHSARLWRARGPPHSLGNMRWRTVVRKMRVVSIATQREPILWVSTDVTDTQH
jgi:hypothetical protein